MTDPAALGRVARSTLAYLEAHATADTLGAHAGLFAAQGVTLEDVKATLALVAETAETAPERLLDPAFLAERFRFIRWSGDAEAAAARNIRLENGQIRLTHYVVWQVSGSPVKTERFDTALYAVPRDEAGVSELEAEARRHALHRYRWTRPDVLAGVYEGGGAAAGQAEPLVWLTREGVLEAMLQGTVEVALPDGATRLYNVDRSNGIAWVAGERNPEKQQRYWYFKERASLAGWGFDGDHKIAVVPGVTVAGDVHDLGLGKLVALRGPRDELRLAVLADTGGAFLPNLFQLDLLVGSYPSREAFREASAALPDRVDAAVLILRR